MVKSKKRGPPYEDDPGCKFIVIEDPWPGNAIGKARTPRYFNYLGAWVFYMLDKKVDAEAIYSVNTRTEVIVKLPEDVDIAPLLGAHKWREFLKAGNPADKDRVSHVFEYNYRSKGDPVNHQWLEIVPLGGDPPPHVHFPVKSPYPRVHWASLADRRCADLALPLPKTRQRTPPSVFKPYERPAHLENAQTAQLAEEESRNAAEHSHDSDGDDDGDDNEEKREVGSEQVHEMPVQGRLKLGKHDPYEEEDAAMMFVKQEPSDDSSQFAEELRDTPVKMEMPEVMVKREPSPVPADNQPSAAFIAMFERSQRLAAESAQSVTVAPQPLPTLPREAATRPVPMTEIPHNTPILDVRVKPEPQEHTFPPEVLSRASASTTTDPRPRGQFSVPRKEHMLPVKPEPLEHALPPPPSRPPPGSSIQQRNQVRSEQKSSLPSFKRIKREEDDTGPKKRIKQTTHY